MQNLENEYQIVEQARHGDRRAFQRLYEGHVMRLFRFLHQFSSDTVQVEEWTQRAFIKAFQRLTTFRGNSAFATWLFSIALNEMRSDTRIRTINYVSEDELPELTQPSEEERFVWSDSMKVLLRDLDEQKKSIFILFEVEGYSHTEIASMLEISEEASRTSLCRTKRWLRTQWQQLESMV